MSEKKIKIKELADELGVRHPDMLNAARDEGITARNIQATVSVEEGERLRKHFEKLNSATGSQQEVIVRRRSRPQRSSAAAERSDASPSDSNKAKQAASTKQANAGRNAEKGAQQRQPRASRPEAAPAKVISRPGDKPSVAQKNAMPEAAKTASAEKAPAPSETKAPVAAPVTSSAQTAENTNAPTTAPAQPKDSGSNTGKQSAPAQDETAHTSEPVQQAATPPASDKNDAGSENDAHKARNIRPSASAAPEGSSAPTLPKHAPRDQEPRRRRDERRSEHAQAAESGSQAEPSAPKVRIISRPTQAAATARSPRPAPSSEAGHMRRDGNNGQQHPRPARPGNGGFRNQGGGAPRQDGMDFGQTQNPDGTTGQSKKKRNKGRRTVDFQSAGFGHHQEEHDSSRLRSKGRRKNNKQPAQPVAVTQPLKAAKRKLRIENAIRVSDMAHQMGLKSNEIIKVLFNLGVMATINQSIDFDTATLVASEFDYEVEKTGFEEKDYLDLRVEDKPEDLKPRPPVVTIMGHVDHGKTSLLDAIRKTHVTMGEAGGITQHIGAYHVNTKNGDVVFLDTPGHEAFTAMRARGAQITDLVILVVAADDGVMEQTREAINHARAANVPIIVAVNKIDKPGANPDRVLRELAELGLQPEEWGGDTIVAKVSAKTHEGLDGLLELVALQSEVMELKANPNKPARGHIIEAKLDKGRGPVASVLIQEGTLHQGDNFVCGTFSGRVRALLNDQGKKVREAGPSIPVEVQGFAGVPVAGEEFAAVTDERVARRIADARAIKQREHDLASESKITLETFLASSADEDQKNLNLVIKADVQGTLEAIQESLKKVATDKVAVNVVHAGTGAITESDILLASASKAIIIGFNIRPTAKIKDVAVHESVDIRYYDIIYKLVDDVKNAMAGLLAPVEKEVYLGQAEVRQTFTLPKVGTIAGAYVADGKIARNAGIRLLRDGVVVHTGKVSSLKRFKDDAKEVVRGNECGIGLENFNDIKVNDIIEAFETVQEAATL